MASSLPRIGSRPNLRLILLPNEGAAQGQQGIASQESARISEERDGRVAAHRAEAAHLFRPVGAPICTILSAERRRAGSVCVGGPRTSSTRHRPTIGPGQTHAQQSWPCV